MTRQVKTHIRWGIHSGSPSDQGPCCPHEETLNPYLSIAKVRGVSPRNLRKCLREISRSFSTNLRGENPRRNKYMFFFSAIFFFAPGVFRGEFIPDHSKHIYLCKC